ncbi:conserved hypothetical protein [Ricinus communis]|uniref:Uncharacterized protein n=1 Tax=Ricinus communis TaxID=3988 RepID=B9SVX8_RICCO|nr:conserved hypothetical protein [Ricinus communis]
MEENFAFSCWTGVDKGGLKLISWEVKTRSKCKGGWSYRDMDAFGLALFNKSSLIQIPYGREL